MNAYHSVTVAAAAVLFLPVDCAFWLHQLAVVTLSVLYWHRPPIRYSAVIVVSVKSQSHSLYYTNIDLKRLTDSNT